jgi:4-amino-4-deoxy-L-arabinose transferase-like glycosyltransferase
MASPEQRPPVPEKHAHESLRQDARRRAVAFGLVFVVAFGVRLLCWRDVRFEAYKVQTSVTENYKHMAHLLGENGVSSFYDPASTTSEPDLLGHPPGYPFVLAAVYGLCGESDAAAQIFQAACDALAAALVFLIAAELLTFGVGVIAGALAVVAPQFCWNSLMLLPDTLAVLPLLAAVWLLVRAREGRPVLKALGAGVLVGLSCWLRANALLLAPFMAFVAVPFLFARGARVRPGLALVAGALLAVAPLTIRNAVVYGHFIPVSLGGGQTLIEGIGDYDPAGRFGLPATDLELQRQEAEMYGRPEYATSLFGPDAIERDRARRARAFAVIRAHPLWFACVMARRASSMLRLERVPLASNAVPVSEGRTRPLRLMLRAAQKLFITAVFLPLQLFGLAALVRARRWRVLAALLTVPLYYFCVQSALHTEYRYVLAIQYLLLAPAALALREAGLWVWGRRPGRRV